jgi:hypothetical protein
MSTPGTIAGLPDGAGLLSVLLGDTRTGTVRAEVSAIESLSCSDGLDPDDVSLRCSIPVDHLAGIDLRRYTNPADMFVALAYADRVLWAGPVWGRKYTSTSGVLDLAASGLMSVFDRRWCSADPRADPRAESTDIHLAGLSLRAVAARLVRYGMASTSDYDDGRLPVTFAAPEDETGTAERHYFGYDLASVGERLRQLSAVDGGPDLHFAPRWRTDRRDGIEWRLRAGAPMLGQVGAPWVWESGANLRDVTTDEDGGGMASLVMVPGDGTDRDKVIGRAERATLQQAGWPGLWQTSRDHASTKEQATVDGYAAEYVRARHMSVLTWSATVAAFAVPEIGEWLVGDYCRVIVPDDPWLSGVDQTRRVVGWTYDGGDTVALTLTPTPGQVS